MMHFLPLSKHSIKILLSSHRIRLCNSNYAKHCTHDWTSKNVQETFINFFTQANHNVVRSSSVLPWNDASLFYVNAGMNQFKPVLLGRASPPCPRAVNSQKCIRVGGRHNDLAAVGTDSYHHTFFEMLGSWSFGDYFKDEACSLAWRLLTEVYGLSADRLYVTYFNGDQTLGVPPDLETRDVWRRLGVPNERILPFGLADNFWEMGAVGPCGPCTELHYYRGTADPGDALTAALVNAGHEDLIELWNVVFVQYERQADGSVSQLPRHHVDTGMGLERLTATLNGQASNYDTDLFGPLFGAIRNASGAADYSGSFSGFSSALDTGYRVLADHARMAVVAVADGSLPSASGNLRKVLHRLYRTAEEQFGLSNTREDWLGPLCRSVADTLHHRYPEVLTGLPRVQAVLTRELQHYVTARDAMLPAWQKLVVQEPCLDILQDSCSLGLIQGLKKFLPDIHRAAGGAFPTHTAVRLNRECGVPFEVIEDVAAVYNSAVDRLDFDRELTKQKRQRSIKTASSGWKKFPLDVISKQLSEQHIPPTNRDPVYRYSRNRRAERYTSHLDAETNLYVYEPIETEIVAIIVDGKLVDRVSSGTCIGVVLKDTNYYTPAGGQISDKGVILLRYINSNNSSNESRASKEAKFIVEEAEQVEGFVIHWGSMEGDGEARVGLPVLSALDDDHRLGCSRHHTATHLLLHALQRLAGGPTSQLSSHVASDHFKLGVGCYGTLSPDDLLAAEQLVQDWVQCGGAIKSRQLALSSALQLPDISMLPGAVYPDTVTVVTAARAGDVALNSGGEGDSASRDFASVEICCGTHLLDVADVGDFVLTAVGRSEGEGMREMEGVCGKAASAVRRAGDRIWANMEQRLMKAMEDRGNPSATAKANEQWAREALREKMPFRVRRQLVLFSTGFSKLLLERTVTANMEAHEKMMSELEAVCAMTDGAVVHATSSYFGASKKVMKAAYTTLEGRSFLLLLHVKGDLRVKAVVTDEAMSRGASATAWLAPLSRAFPEGRVTSGTDPRSLASFSLDGVRDERLLAARDELMVDFRRYITPFDSQQTQPQARTS